MEKEMKNNVEPVLQSFEGITEHSESIASEEPELQPNSLAAFPLEYSIIESPYTVSIISTDNTPGNRPGCCGKCSGGDSCTSNKGNHDDETINSDL